MNGRTPLEALETPDAALAKHVREFLQKKKRAKYKVVPLEVGDKVRYLLDAERGITAGLCNVVSAPLFRSVLI